MITPLYTEYVPRHTKTRFAGHGIELLDSPAQSPDLERVSQSSLQSLLKRAPVSKSELASRVQF